MRQEFTEYDWPISLFYRAAKLDHLVDNKSTYSELLNSSELLVISYLGTVCLEALMNNIPSIFFFDPGCWFVRENARPFFDDLRDVKILHNTPESAASHLNSIESHVSVWWNNETLQDVRHRFCEEFSYTEKFWQSKWGDAVRQII